MNPQITPIAPITRKINPQIAPITRKMNPQITPITRKMNPQITQITPIARISERSRKRIRKRCDGVVIGDRDRGAVP